MNIEMRKRIRIWTFAVVAICVAVASATVSAQCYEKNYRQAENLYKLGTYAAAKKRFMAAQACPDKPSNNSLSQWIRDCDRMLQSQSAPQPTPSRTRPRQRTETRTESLSVTNVVFRNEDINDNELSSFGDPLNASEVLYLMPRITYTYSGPTRNRTFYYKIIRPDGTMMSASSSPSGYTNSFSIELEEGLWSQNVAGWGSAGGGSFTPGSYRFEVWSNGKRYYNGSFYLGSGLSSTGNATYLNVSLTEGDGIDNFVVFDPTPESVVFSVRTDGDWRLWGVPSWCEVVSQTSGSFTLRCEANPTTEERDDYFKVLAGDKEFRIDVNQLSGTGRTASPSAVRTGEVVKVWVDYDQWQDGRKGMIVHVEFTVDGMLGRTGKAAAYFSYSDGSRLESTDDDFTTPDGQVVMGYDFVPKYESTRFNDFQMFIPYDEFHIASGSGTSHLKFYVLLYDVDTEEDLARSDDYYFDYSN